MDYLISFNFPVFSKADGFVLQCACAVDYVNALEYNLVKGSIVE